MKIFCGIWLAMMAVAGAARLDFPKVLQEIHAPAEALKVTADFEFTNRSDKPVTITKYDPSCSCIGVKVSDGKLRYAPGESGLIRAEFDMGNFAGTVDKVVAVWLDGDPKDKPSVQLTVRVHIPVLVVLEPKVLKWNTAGSGEAQTMRITIADSHPMRVVGVTSTSEAFDYQLKTIEENKRYELIVKPKNLATPALGIFRIETDSKLKKYRVQQAFASISKPLPKRNS